MNPDRDLDLDRLKAYLRQFEPRAPRPLPGKPRPMVRPPVLIAALAAMVLIVVSLLVWRRRTEPSRLQPVTQAAQAAAGEEITVAQLSRIARQQPEKLDSHLDRLSVGLLP